MTDRICGVVCASGPKNEPLACAFKPDHDGAHSWASLPTFTQGMTDAERELRQAIRDLMRNQPKARTRARDAMKMLMRVSAERL